MHLTRLMMVSSAIIGIFYLDTAYCKLSEREKNILDSFYDGLKTCHAEEKLYVDVIYVHIQGYNPEYKRSAQLSVDIHLGVSDERTQEIIKDIKAHYDFSQPYKNMPHFIEQKKEACENRLLENLNQKF